MELDKLWQFHARVKSLEAEVVHLRTWKSDWVGEAQKLSIEIGWLRGIIASYNIILSLP
jgi:hypothetical protein